MPGTTGAQVSGAGGCAQIRPELGVYVLGAITPVGRAVVGRHLVSCLRCGDEVAGIPAMLRRVPVAAERFDLFESWWEWLREFEADRAGRPS